MTVVINLKIFLLKKKREDQVFFNTYLNLNLNFKLVILLSLLLDRNSQ